MNIIFIIIMLTFSRSVSCAIMCHYGVCAGEQSLCEIQTVQLEGGGKAVVQDCLPQVLGSRKVKLLGCC